MIRKAEVKNQIQKFITSTHRAKLDQVSFGFEVETQSNGGEPDYDQLDFDELYDTEQMYDDLYEETIEQIENNKPSELLEYLSNYDICPSYRETFPCKSKIEKWIKNNIMIYAQRLEERVDTCGNSDLKLEIIKRIIKRFAHTLKPDVTNEWLNIADLTDSSTPYFDSIRDSVENAIDYSYYRYDDDYLRENYPHIFSDELGLNDDDDIEIVEDQSISGQEIRTIGGKTYEDTIEIAKYVFDEIKASDHYIDKDCSCHVHVKLGDIKHYFGDGNLHAAIMEYFALNMHRLPESVQERLNQGGNRWIEPKCSSGKYRWVNFHGQGTIEFRLFGNVDNIDDFVKCIDLAIESLSYGYQIRFGDYTRKLDNETIESDLYNFRSAA